MNILLVEPKISRAWGKNNQFVGLLRIANWLNSTGHNTRYVQYPDFPLDRDFVPDQIYVTSMFTYHYRYVWDAVGYYKFWYPHAHVMLGGIYASLCPEHAKGSGADEIFVGQIPEVANYPPDPSVLPYKQNFAYLFTGYGCDRSCTFCATSILFGRGVKHREPGLVVDDMEFLLSKGYRQILIGDDNILAKKEEHIQEICIEILKRGISVDLRVPGGMSAKDLDWDTAELMHRAGFTEFSFGFESLSPEQRKRMGRANHTNDEDLEKALSYLDKLGYERNKTRCFFIIGLPYQTIDDMLDTLVYLVSLGVEPRAQRLTPIPGTVEWKRMGLEGWDLEALDYRTFTAPDQDNFTSDDLSAINNLAYGFIVMIQRVDNWITGHGKKQRAPEVSSKFRKKFASMLQEVDFSAGGVDDAAFRNM